MLEKCVAAMFSEWWFSDYNFAFKETQSKSQLVGKSVHEMIYSKERTRVEIVRWFDEIFLIIWKRKCSDFLTNMRFTPGSQLSSL